MARVSLKNIIGKKNETSTLVVALLEKLGTNIFIEDDQGKLLIGKLHDNPEHQEPIQADMELIGWVKGDMNATLLAQLISHLAQKEYERKKLGSEVLNLYQEVNLMYNFSDKLAETIDAADIARVTLEEASHVIRSDNGVVVLWDEDLHQLQAASSKGELFFVPEKINSELPLLLKLILSGQSEIIEDTGFLTDAGIILPV